MDRNEGRVQLFDDWAEHYDASTEKDEGFPFGGYARVLDVVMEAAEPEPGMDVLDLGIGTGKLAARFAALGCNVWGIDFSAEMLARARERLERAVLVRADLLGKWPPELACRFERIVSAYVLHEFELSEKVTLLRRLSEQHLAAGGRIVIGDVTFPTVAARELARRRWETLWDEEEYYWAADVAAEALMSVGLSVNYEQISSCAGVFVIEPAEGA